MRIRKKKLYLEQALQWSKIKPERSGWSHPSIQTVCKTKPTFGTLPYDGHLNTKHSCQMTLRNVHHMLMLTVCGNIFGIAESSTSTISLYTKRFFQQYGHSWLSRTSLKIISATMSITVWMDIRWKPFARTFCRKYLVKSFVTERFRLGKRFFWPG